MTKNNKISINKKRDLLSITDLTSSEFMDILRTAKSVKNQLQTKKGNIPLLKQKTLAMIFEKPSLRTRLSFEIGMTQLGGHAVYLGPNDIGLGKRESIHDVARVTGSMADIIMARTFSHRTVEEIARFAPVPVINGLSDSEHPCQTLADFMTIWENKKKLNHMKLSFIGDGENNVPHSLCLAAALFGAHFICAAPKGYAMRTEIIAKARTIAQKTGAIIEETDNPNEAVKDADVVYTDTWVSMGDEAEKEKRLAIFSPFQVTKHLMKLAKKDAIFMHDMPAYRGNEVTSEVIDGPQSVIFQQAENRLHAQKGLILFLLKII